jgi:hypothetical protein
MVDISSTRYSFTGTVAVTVAVGAGVKMIVVTTEGTTLMLVKDDMDTTLCGCSTGISLLA